MSRTFLYIFEDGYECEHACLPNMAFEELERLHGDCTYNGWAEFMGVGKRSTMAIIGGANTGGFRTGYHPGLNMEIKSPSHYKQVLRERGLVETGDEQRKAKTFKAAGLDKGDIQDLRKQGAEISDREADVLTGEAT
jgi:hypothetical protein